MITREEYLAVRKELAWLFTAEEMATLEPGVPTVAKLFRERERDRELFPEARGFDPHDLATVQASLVALRELWHRPSDNPTRTIPGDHVIVYAILEAASAVLAPPKEEQPQWWRWVFNLDTGYKEWIPSGLDFDTAEFKRMSTGVSVVRVWGTTADRDEKRDAILEADRKAGKPCH